MKSFKPPWWEIVLAVTGIVFLVLGTKWVRSGELPEQQIVIQAGGCHTPATILNPRITNQPPGTVIVLHGLSANRRIMMYLAAEFAGHGLQVYSLDLAGHGDNTDAFSFAKAAECATAAVESLSRSGKIDRSKTIVVGHSLGGAIAIGMADHIPVSGTIALSPAPLVLPQRMPSNLLVFSGQYELAILHRTAEALLHAAGGTRDQPEDFAQKRAFDLRYQAGGTHTSLVMDRDVAHQSERWIMQCLFPEIAPETLALNLDLAPYAVANKGRHRLAGSVLGLIGILLLFPFCAALVASVAGPPHAEPLLDHPPYALSLAEAAVAALAGILLLPLGIPLKFLHIYTADYFLSVLLMVGLVLLFFNRARIWESWPPSAWSSIIAAIFALAVVLSLGAWLNWQLDDAWLNEPRWIRFAAILPITLIFCGAEELVLGPVQSGKRRALRFAVFLWLRLEIILACTLAYYELRSGQVLIPLLAVFLALFSVLQRLGADALRKRTGSIAAAILFSAILAAWFVAAVFPLT
ncbi:MAG TPA: alpha/beta fold hydrolase [Candidatus Binatus sp.]|jgi:pimeloyl-ACP methyl ester carboxylesterase|nr:alpha/beta fold hydrolase [Candidatus Binatus sp.]